MEFTRTTVSLTPPMLSDLKAEARAQGMTVSELVRAYIRAGRLRDESGSVDLRRERETNDDRR